MKRQWHVVPVLFGMLLLALALLVFAFWPETYLRMPAEEVVGIDGARGTLYTLQFKDDQYELHGYSLFDGGRQKKIVLTPISRKAPPSIVFTDDAGDQIADSTKIVSRAWKWSLSPNKQILVAMNEYQDNLQMFDVNSGEQLRQLSFPKDVATFLISEISFSEDCTHIVLRTMSEHFYVWELSTGQLVHHFDNSEHSGMVLISKPSEIWINHSHFAPAQNYLAIATGNKTVLRDLKANKILIEHPGLACVSRILNGGNLVVMTPSYIDPNCKPVWYQKQPDGNWIKLPIDLATGGKECRFVAYTLGMLVTIKGEKIECQWRGSVPTALWPKLNQLFQLSGIKQVLQFWDLQTGILRTQYVWFQADHTSPADWRDLLDMRLINTFDEPCMVADNGNWLVRSSDQQLTVWKIPYTRPKSCWFICISLVLLTFWIARPRILKKSNIASPLPSPAKGGGL